MKLFSSRRPLLTCHLCWSFSRLTLPSAQRFSGACEWEVWSLKTALMVICWNQSHHSGVSGSSLLPRITDTEDNTNRWPFSVPNRHPGTAVCQALKGEGLTAPPTGAKRTAFKRNESGPHAEINSKSKCDYQKIWETNMITKEPERLWPLSRPRSFDRI